VKLEINGESRELDVEPDTPLLWAIRDGLQLTGTKYGCGIAQCGSCIVLVDGDPVRSCITPVSTVSGKQVTTIEGLAEDSKHPVQQAWIENEVPQCGYCQSGQILAASALLARIPNPTDADIDENMRDVLCRCGTYPRIRTAIKQAAVNAGKTTKGE
jgi:aerobic-type carbon monoxide dehydrogenase small subunit (CoxS/CutS family)